RARDERRIVPDLLIVAIALQGAFAQDSVRVQCRPHEVRSRGHVGDILPLTRDADVVDVGPARRDPWYLQSKYLIGSGDHSALTILSRSIKQKPRFCWPPVTSFPLPST